MGMENLENLARVGKLTKEPPRDDELDGLLASGRDRLKDAKNPENSFAGRFDLAYNAAHSLALCALRRAGYRADNRYIVFQFLPHTLDFDEWQILAKAHNIRNKSEYEGYLREDEKLLGAVIEIASELVDALEASLE